MRFFRTVTRIAAAVVLALVVVYVAARGYLVYEVYRAKVLFAELAAVRIGDTEASIGPLISRYGGHKWVRENSPADVYVYDIGVNPWHFLTIEGPSQRFDEAVWSKARDFHPRFRRVIGLRRWLATGDLSIRGGRVEAVSASVIHEGWSEWLMGKWSLVSHTAEGETQPPIKISGGFLTFADGGGGSTEVSFTPSANSEQIQAARDLNLACLTGTRGCRGSCELMPKAVAYLKRHPNAADIAPDCAQQAKGEPW